MKKRRAGLAPSRTRNRSRMVFAIPAVMVLAAAAAAFWLWPAPAPVEGGTPRLEADRTEIDLGAAAYNRWVTATFTLRNAGDGPLQIAGAPRVRAVQGC